MNQLALLLVAALAATTTQAAEYVIITDPTITSPEVALERFIEDSPVLSNRGGLRPSRRRPSFKAQVNLTEHHNFGLLDDVEEEDLAQLKQVSGVVDVVLNINISHASMGTSEKTTQWNLDRIDQSFGRDGVYIPAKEDGTGVDMYIIDSGVNPHSAFGSRLQTGFSAVFPDLQGNNDCNGHGTHVASTAAGLEFGVARGAKIIPVQILNCAGQGSLMNMANGVSWVLNNIKQTSGAKRSVVNLSIQAVANSGIDELVRQLYNAGAVVAVAAANYNTDACNYSPAREPLAVTVGASSQDDSKLPSSNFGSCVDLFAPGDDIIGASIEGLTATTQKQGTSMASPLVAGVLATLRQKYPAYTNAQIVTALLATSATLTTTPVMDLDCGGQIPGVKFLQGLSAADVKPANSLAVGSVLKSDFLNWAPQLRTQAVNGEMCVTFSAQVASLYNPAKYGDAMAVMRLALSTNVLPLGITNYFTTSLSCRSLTPRFYVIEDGPYLAQVSDYMGKQVGDQVKHANAPLQEMSSSTATDFYVTMKADAEGTVITFGRGDGSSDRNRDEVLSVRDPTSKLTAGSYQYLSFSTPNQQDLQFSNVRSCNGGNGGSDGEVTLPPASSGGDLPVEVTELQVSAADKGKFSLWPSSWVKKDATSQSCMIFSVDLKIQGSFSVAMANQALGVVPIGTFLGMSVESVLYEFQITKTRTKLIRNGEVLVNAVNKLKFAAAARMAKFRASLNNGLIRVELFRNQKWMLLFSYAKDKAALSTGAGKRMALASSLPRTFTTISMC
ncbi:hypothetical protein BASA81_003069 [Batrachochytrium salamandrivorans]|nr:hypothetical protein BASA81_003069 [Batrachochytrium salamandrivorans]